MGTKTPCSLMRALITPPLPGQTRSVPHNSKTLTWVKGQPTLSRMRRVGNPSPVTHRRFLLCAYLLLASGWSSPAPAPAQASVVARNPSIWETPHPPYPEAAKLPGAVRKGTLHVRTDDLPRVSRTERSAG